MARAYDGTVGSVAVGKGSIGSFLGGNAYIGYYSTIATYPGEVSGGLDVCKVIVNEDDNYCLRGEMPGYYDPLHTCPLTHLSTIDDVPGIEGRRVMAFNGTTGTALALSGNLEILVDIDGPWE